MREPTRLRRRRLRRIQWRLPLTIAALLLAVVAGLSWMAYNEVRAGALRTAGDRLQDVAGQLASLFAQALAIRRTEVEAVARDSAVLAALAEPGDAALSDARRVLGRLLASSEQVLGVDLWDATGSSVVRERGAGADTIPAVGAAFPIWAAGGDTARVSGLRAEGDLAWYEVAAEVRRDARPVGYVVELRAVTTPGAALGLIGNLIGMDARFALGEAGGIWTDLRSVVAGPPAAETAGGAPVIYRENPGGRLLGAGQRIGGSPLSIWVTFPLARVLERPRAYLARMAPLGLLIVLLGAAGGWALSRPITERIGDLTRDAGAIAAGDFGHVVRVTGDDELTDLAVAFGRMADSLASALDTARKSQDELRALNLELEERVTERTAALRDSEEQFRTLAAAAPDAIVAADGAGRITYYNSAAERTFGHTANEVLGRSLTLLMPERLHEAHRRGLARSVAAGAATLVGRTLEVSGRRKDGTEFPVELSLASHRLGQAPVFIAIIRDTTRRTQAEEAAQRYAGELESVNKELEAFSYSVSHDLRAPLRSIHGFSQAVLEDYHDRLDPEGAAYLARVCAAAEHMGRLIDDLIELSRASRVEMQRTSVDLSRLAEEIAADLVATHPERSADVRIEPGLRALGDPRLLAHVLRNLMENAWKFTAREPRPVIDIGITDGQEPAFFVRDNGAGFDATYADKLFQAFQRLHSPRDFPGTGIGLALVQRIIRRHGGRVWAEGAVDAGATFYFTLPGLGPGGNT